MRAAIAGLAFSLAALAGGARAIAGDDLPVPRGTRAAGAAEAAAPPGSVTRGGAALISGAGFGPTVEHVEKELARRGLVFHRVGPYRAHGVDVARFVADDERAPWLAIHVFRARGKTWISFVKRAP